MDLSWHRRTGCHHLFERLVPLGTFPSVRPRCRPYPRVVLLLDFFGQLGTAILARPMRGRIPFPRDRRTSPFSRWTRRSNRLLGWPCPAPATPSDLGGPCWRLGGSHHAFFFPPSTHVDVSLRFETRNHRLSTARSFRRPSLRLWMETRPPLTSPTRHRHTPMEQLHPLLPLSDPAAHAPRSIVHGVCLPPPLSLSVTLPLPPSHRPSPSPLLSVNPSPSQSLSLSIPLHLSHRPSPCPSLSQTLSLSISLTDPLPLNPCRSPSLSISFTDPLPVHLSHRPSHCPSLSQTLSLSISLTDPLIVHLSHRPSPTHRPSLSIPVSGLLGRCVAVVRGASSGAPSDTHLHVSHA